MWRARTPNISAIFAGRRGRSQSLGRELTSYLYRTLLNLLTGLPKDASNYVLMDRRLVEGMVTFPTSHPWIPAMIGCLGPRTRSVPVRRLKRAGRRSSYTSLARLRAALTGVACVIGYRLGATTQPYVRDRGKAFIKSLTRARAVGAAAPSPRQGS